MKMKLGFVPLALMLLAFLSPLPTTAASQHPQLVKFKPMFVVLRHPGVKAMASTSSTLPQWNGSFNYKGQTYHFTMVGKNPASNNATTTIPVYIIPIKLVFGPTNGAMGFDPVKKTLHGHTIVVDTVNSPIFDGGLDFNQGGTDLGTTQYLDAYQRGNFWQFVGTTNPNYHIMLGTPTVLAEQTIHVKPSQGLVVSAFGTTIGLMNINDFDAAIQTIMASFPQLNAKVLPIFLTYNVYLSNTSDASQCCIGGYHSFNGFNTYMHASYIGTNGAFAQDVSALSHEVGEWMDDPFANNIDVPALCGTNGGGGLILENGDPLEGEANFGGYPYALNGLTYNLQDLVFIPYFGAPRTKSVNSWWTFQGTTMSVCSNGG
jgi:hypothetical protein